MIQLIEREFAAAWINIRTSPVPDVPCMKQVLNGVRLDENRHVQGTLERGFFLRSVVLASDGRTHLNPQPAATFAYAQVKADDYLAMLEDALRGHRALLEADAIDQAIRRR